MASLALKVDPSVDARGGGDSTLKAAASPSLGLKAAVSPPDSTATENLQDSAAPDPRPDAGRRHDGVGLAERDWQTALREAIREPGELCRLLELPAEISQQAERAAAPFSLLVPHEFLARIRKGDPHDPLLRQVLPLDAENVDVAGFGTDPVGDSSVHVAPGLLHKYQGRALLIVTGLCPVHCRYCFRRHFPYSTAPRGLEAWEPALAHIAADGELHEIILSGGDPLVLGNRPLGALIERLEAVPHVRRLRIHTRMPVMIPQRVNQELVARLQSSRLTTWMVVHINHPREIDEATVAALRRLIDAGIMALNQAVLLAGVNDDADTLAQLCERLVDLRVMPYYLHQLDRVRGAAHFEVSDDRAREIVSELQTRLPGYAVPKLVREVAGAMHKVALGP